ncbi:MAG: hypothetical protein ACOC8B_00420 [Gemmatimonadota bacterium]
MYDPYPHRALLGAAVLSLVSGLAACGESPLEPEFDEEEEAYVVVHRTGDLVQTLAFSDPTPSVGDTLSIRSTVINRGAPRGVESRICGLDVRGEVELSPASATCGGWSSSGTLAPGDSVIGWEHGVVNAEPGRRVLRVRHLIDPEVWLDVELTIRSEG